MKIVFLLVLLFLLPLFSLLGQKSYMDGYIVTSSKDTLYGKLKIYKSEALNCSRAKFYNDSIRRKTFAANELLAYKRGEDLFLRKAYLYPKDLNYPGNTGLMKVLDTGVIDLFRFDYISNDEIPYSYGMLSSYSEPGYDYYIQTDKGLFYLIPKQGLTDFFARYFVRNYRIYQLILWGKVSYLEVEAIIKEFNQHPYN